MFGFFNNLFGSNPNDPAGIDNVQIQYQDETGNWRTVSSTINNPQYIISEMQAVQDYHDGARVRAVNSFGQIVDII